MKAIVILEFVLAVVFFALTIPVLGFRYHLFAGDVLAILGLAVGLSILFIAGAFMAPRKNGSAFPRKRLPTGQEYIFTGIAFMFFGALNFLSDKDILCGNTDRHFCWLIREAATLVGGSTNASAIAIVFFLLGTFCLLKGFWLKYSVAQGKK